MKVKRLAARLIVMVMLVSLLTTFVCAANDDFRYAIHLKYFQHNWNIEINGVNASAISDSHSDIVLTDKDRVRLELRIFPNEPYSHFSENHSHLLRFASSEDGSLSTTYTRQDAIILPDGTYAVISPAGETLVFDELHLTESKDALNYDFSFEGEYNAVDITLEDIRKAGETGARGGDLLELSDASKTYSLRIRAEGHTDSPVSLEHQLDERDLLWHFVLTESNGFTAKYEINTGNGWEPFDIASWKSEKDNRDMLLSGRNFIYDGYSFSLRTAYGETPTFELIDPVTAGGVAAAAAAAAVGAAVASSAASATANTLSVSVAGSNTALTKPSILINGGGAYPSLTNTQKATVELLLNMDTSFGEIYKWSAFATAPDCLKSVTAAAVPPFGESSTAVIMISGEKLPKNKIPVFLEIKAVGFDGEEYTASAELTLYEKGLFAELKNAERPQSPESYTVTKVSDANLDGIAEVKTLDPTEYIVELYEEKAVIRVGDESTTVEL